MFREMGMLNSYLPLYLPLAFATQGFFVFMLIQFHQQDGARQQHGGDERREPELLPRDLKARKAVRHDGSTAGRPAPNTISATIC
jgi:hypothetical protein